MPKPIINQIEREWMIGDVVQVTNIDHYCFPTLFIVRAVRSRGVKAYGFTFSEGVPQTFYINLDDDDIELVGSAVLVERSE